MTDPLDLFREWRDADRQAHALENDIALRLIAALHGQVPPPEESEQRRVHALRATATELFAVAMARMSEQVQANRKS